jgi:hypothetical protein
VAAEKTNDPRHPDVDRALQAWRQSDCVLGQHWFVHRLDPAFTVTDAGRTAAEQGVDLAEQEVAGLTVVSQTCDIVRSCTERAFVEVSPLVKIEEGRLREIERGRRPAYAYLPRLAHRHLVADLDRTMTVEKPVVAKWERTPACSIDSEARAFAQALARKRARFAFPDDFTALAKRLLSRLVDKHDKDTFEGRALRALREIRVRAAPAWDGDAVTLMFWFVRRDENVDFEGRNWASFLEGWLKLLPESGRFTKVQGQVTTLGELTADDFVHSDPLDVDHLSSGEAANND